MPKVRHRLRYPQGHLEVRPGIWSFQSPGCRSLQSAFKEYSASLLNKINALGAGTIAGADAGGSRTPRQSPAQGNRSVGCDHKKLTKLLALYLPYLLLGLVANELRRSVAACRGQELGERIMSMGTVRWRLQTLCQACIRWIFLVSLCCGAGATAAVYLRGKNAKKYRHGMEYGSAGGAMPGH